MEIIHPLASSVPPYHTMHAFQKMAGAARKRLFRRSTSHQAGQLDAATRNALVDDVTSPTTALQQELTALETEIAQARQALKQSEDKEVFLGQRSRQYRKALDEQARQLKQEQAQLQDQQADQVETAAQAELDAKMEKWERDEDALQKIVATHKQILGHNETMRWRLKELEAKRKACRSQLAECTDFLSAAEQAHEMDQQEQEESAVAAAPRDNNPTTEVVGDPMIQIINDDEPDKDASANGKPAQDVDAIA